MKDNIGWWRGAVIYQIYPRSFADSNDDGVGDLTGIVRHLDYIAALGVDAIWVSPFFQSPMKDFGYDISDYRAVDPLFGTLDDFRTLLSEAHARGLKVMIDQVLSHSADQHPWFVESRSSRDNPRADWYVWADPKADGTPPNNWMSVFGGSAWHWDTRRRQYYLHNFLASQPDLNFHSPAVQDAVLEDVKFWLELGVDGMRFDACNFFFHDALLRDNPEALVRDTVSVSADNPYGFQAHRFDKSQPENLSFLQRLRTLINSHHAVALGEIGDDNSLSLMAAYTSHGDKLHMAYSFNFLTPEFSAAFIRSQVEQFEAVIGDGWGCWTTGNHDSVRVLTRWGHNDNDPRMLRTIAAMLMSLRGSVCLYQGEELGLPEVDLELEQLRDPYGIAMWPEFKGRDGCRTPIPWQHNAEHGGFSTVTPWLPVPEAHLQRAADLQEADPGSLLQFYRQFIEWRAQHSELREEAIRFLDLGDEILGYQRGRLVCVFNLSAQARQTVLPEPVRAVTGHGLDGATLDGQALMLDAWGGWFGEIAMTEGALPSYGD